MDQELFLQTIFFDQFHLHGSQESSDGCIRPLLKLTVVEVDLNSAQDDKQYFTSNIIMYT